MITEDTVVVFTAKSPATILREGGSQAWKLDPTRAKKCTWLVCTQNAHNVEDYADGNEPHGSAFLIGRISRISPATEVGVEGRWKVEFSEYARIASPNVWGGDRNPVRYTSLDALGLDLDGVDFQKVDRDSAVKPTPAVSAGLTIAQAKAGLAATYGVSVDAIEIVIRG
ncbi:hypothetical protein [Speluncibacter jeojiensis]|uniref:Uncharacterized protein n=1 Tax=Speluncibacter jeojiensis TaxID=2710754 RepID=A0A9X4M0N2_9ACTN|nr:hypothetical protein [Corynebacteriales bacterium D3-21]